MQDSGIQYRCRGRREGSRFLRHWIAIITLLALPLAALAQLPLLRTYRIACDPAEFNQIYATPHEDIYIDCEFSYEGQVWHNARLRIRGDSSRDYPKKSLKVNFDGNEPFFGRDKVNLNAEYGDVTFSHEFLSYEFFRRAGMPASRTHFVRLFVNNVFKGVYVDVEQVDEQFLARENLPEDASVYKAAVDGAQLRHNEPVEELWTKETGPVTGFIDLKQLIDWLATVPDNRFYEELGERFDRPELARHMAINAIISNSSTYYHNYYLLHDPHPGGKWKMIPWDMDRSNRSWGPDFSEPRYYATASPNLESVNTLIAHCWRDSAMRVEIADQLEGLADSLVTHAYYDTMTAYLDTLLEASVAADPLSQFTVEEFHSHIVSLPDLLVQRAAYLRSVPQLYPTPFDLHPGMASGDSLLISWEPSSLAGGGEVRYRVSLDTVYTLTTAQLFETVNDTFLAVPGLPAKRYYWNVEAYTLAGKSTYSLRWYRGFDYPGGTSSGTAIADDLAGNTTWSPAGSPYRVAREITIPEGVTLKINPGTELLFDAGAGLVVRGRLQVQAAADSVFFRASRVDSPWNGIEVSGANGSLSLSKVRLSGIEGVGIRVRQGASCWVDSSLFTGESGTILVEDGYLHLAASRFDQAGPGMVDLRAGSASLTSLKLLARPNNAEPLLHLALSEGDSLVLKRCDISAVEGVGVDVALDGGRLRGTRFSVSGQPGASGLRITGNGEVLLDNFLVEGFTAGIELPEGGEARLVNGVLAHNGAALSCADPSAADPWLRNLAFWDNDTTFALAQQVNDIGWCFLPFGEGVSGSGLIEGDNPGFADGWTGDYHLLPTSPLIDAGLGTGVPATDGDGLPRLDVPGIPNRGVGLIGYVDIGKFEYQQGVVGPPTPPDILPGENERLFSYPNPFNDATVLVFDLKRGTTVELTIFNVLGQEVFGRRLVGLNQGRHRFGWNGRTLSGIQLPSGLYICRLKQESGVTFRKLLLVR